MIITSWFDAHDDDDDDDVVIGPRQPVVDSPCLRQLKESQKNKKFGAFVPRCADNGDYLPEQCQGDTGFCYCATKDGKEIQGTRRKAPESPICAYVGMFIKSPFDVW